MLSILISKKLKLFAISCLWFLPFSVQALETSFWQLRFSGKSYKFKVETEDQVGGTSVIQTITITDDPNGLFEQLTQTVIYSYNHGVLNIQNDQGQNLTVHYSAAQNVAATQSIPTWLGIMPVGIPVPMQDNDTGANVVGALIPNKLDYQIGEGICFINQNLIQNAEGGSISSAAQQPLVGMANAHKLQPGSGMNIITYGFVDLKLERLEAE